MRYSSLATVLLYLVVLSGSNVAVRGQTLYDTVGFTDRDRQVYGPALRYIVNDTLRGVHVVWKGGFGDIYYNFRARDSSWRWAGGTVINLFPRNLGCLAVDRATGRAVIGTDYLFRNESQTSYFQDSAAGQARFRERDVISGFRGLVPASSYYVTLFAGERNDTLFGLSLFTFQRIGRVGSFPGYSVAGARNSARFCYVWTSTDGPDCGTLYIKETPNNGANWYANVNLSDSAPGPFRYSRFGGSAVYDSIRLYLVTAFYDGLRPNHSEIWLYAKYDTPPWTRIHEFGLPDSVRIGDHALACCRPTIAQNPRNSELFVVWEQFDPGNVDPLTGLCRADVWAARSGDSGRTWGRPVRLTRPDQCSKRFPFLAEVADDTLRIICFADSVAGFWEQGQGPRTRNPVLYLRFPTDQLPTGLAEDKRDTVELSSSSHVVQSVVVNSFAVRCPGQALVQVFDPAGRMVRSQRVWRTASDIGWNLNAGVYFVRVVSDNGSPQTSRVAKVR
ncbi:MAG: T9SS type A sorting domain-containing protein [candidate division WOR-3 bacterium]